MHTSRAFRGPSARQSPRPVTTFCTVVHLRRSERYAAILPAFARTLLGGMSLPWCVTSCAPPCTLSPCMLTVGGPQQRLKRGLCQVMDGWGPPPLTPWHLRSREPVSWRTTRWWRTKTRATRAARARKAMRRAARRAEVMAPQVIWPTRHLCVTQLLAIAGHTQLIPFALLQRVDGAWAMRGMNGGQIARRPSPWSRRAEPVHRVAMRAAARRRALQSHMRRTGVVRGSRTRQTERRRLLT